MGLNLQQIAESMGLSASTLRWLGRSASQHYGTWERPKRSGGVRVIYNPDRPIRKAQYWILTELLDPIPVSEVAAAYRVGVGISAAMKPHAGAATLVRVDLTDFFGSITDKMIYPHIVNGGAEPGDAAMVLTQICTVNGRTVQGAITSPMLSNLVCIEFDVALSSLASQWGGVATRYCDDILVSSTKVLGDAACERLVNDIRRVCQRQGFTIAEHKTRVMNDGQNLNALGMNANERVRIRRQTRRAFRAACFNLDKMMKIGAEPGRELDRLRGMYAHIYSVEKDYAEMMAEKYTWLINKKEGGG